MKICVAHDCTRPVYIGDLCATDHRAQKAGRPVHYSLNVSDQPASMYRGACRDEDPELFFPIGTTGPALIQIEQAKAVCRRCPAQPECLQWALENGQDAGVWGGMSEEERRALKRRGGYLATITARRLTPGALVAPAPTHDPALAGEPQEGGKR